MISILVTGANGQLGSDLQVLAPQYPDYQFVWTDIAELDLTSEAAVNSYFENHTFDYCLNCAAYTAVDKAEDQKELAHKVNAKAPELLAKHCALHGVKMVHVSTDYVYHSDQNTPFQEGDPATPKSVYGRTKLEGDNLVLDSDAQVIVLRTSWVYSRHGNNFAKTMIRLGRERDELGVVFDQIGTPTYAYDLAKAILDIIHKVEHGNVEESAFNGLYHYSNEGVGSWYDFAKAIFDIKGIECRLRPIETAEYPTPAARPAFSLLNKRKIKESFGLEIPHWQDSLKECLKGL